MSGILKKAPDSASSLLIAPISVDISISKQSAEESTKTAAISSIDDECHRLQGFEISVPAPVLLSSSLQSNLRSATPMDAKQNPRLHGEEKPPRSLFSPFQTEKTAQSCSVIPPSDNEADDSSTSSLDLLEQDGVCDLLKAIDAAAKTKADPIIERIGKYLEELCDEKDRQTKASIILRELKGLMAANFSEHDGGGVAYEMVFNAIKGKADSRMLSKISMSHTFTIPRKKATVLKEICPALFESESESEVSTILTI